MTSLELEDLTHPRAQPGEPSNESTNRWKAKPRQVFWFTFALMFIVSAAWSIGLPLMGNLDEPSHTVKAAAVARGEFGSDETAYGPGRGDVELPNLFFIMTQSAACFGFQPDSVATCQPPLAGDLSAETLAYTTAARYNPLYYAIVGSPSLFGSSEATVYLMRLMSCLLASLMLAFVFRTIAEIARSHWLMLGAVVCITPTVVNLSAAINPQSTELAGSLLVWVTLLAILKDPQAELLMRRMARLTIGTVLFVNARGLGPLYLALILIVVLLVSPWRNVVEVIKNRRTWPFIAACGVGTLGALLWIQLAGSLTMTDPNLVPFPNRTGWPVIWDTVNLSSYFVEGTIGSWAWGPSDTKAPLWMLLVMAGTILFVIFAGFAVARFSEKFVMIGLALAVLAIPVLAHFREARFIDFFWQGRYVLPLAFGVPVLAGFAMLKPSTEIPLWLNRKIMTWILMSVVLFQTCALAWSVHRFVNGLNGNWLELTTNSWSPPINPVLIVVVAAIGWIVLVLLLVRAVENEPRFLTAVSTVDITVLPEDLSIEGADRTGVRTQTISLEDDDGTSTRVDHATSLVKSDFTEAVGQIPQDTHDDRQPTN